MQDESSDIYALIETIKYNGLESVLLHLYENAKNRGFFFYQPQSIEEKQKLDFLVKAGVILISDSDFRLALDGQVKTSEFVGELTNLGKQIAVYLNRN